MIRAREERYYLLLRFWEQFRVRFSLKCIAYATVNKYAKGQFLPTSYKYNSMTHQSSFGFNERSVLPVHLVIKSTGVTEVVSSTIATPKGCTCRSTVDTFPAFWWREKSSIISHRNIQYFQRTNAFLYCKLSTQFVTLHYTYTTKESLH